MKNKTLEEDIVDGLWKKIDDCGFVKSTNSVTGKQEMLDPIVNDMEATIEIRGEFDKYAIEEWLTTALTRVREEERKRVRKISAEYFEKGLGFNKGSMNDSLFQKLKNDLLQTLNNKE